MGYSVVLWNIPEQKLQDGDIVPVYIRSNISNVYVIGIHSSKTKIEVPLWQISEPHTKFGAHRLAKKYAEYKHQYATVALDGLPVRIEPVNTAKQVYRLRKGETVKLLYKGKGQTVMAGKKPLEGDWLHVITQDGTQGWCFSYNLRQFETDASGERVSGAELSETETKDEVMPAVLSKVWYPDYFQTMISTGSIDPVAMNASYCFKLDSETQKLSINIDKIHGTWDYTGEDKTGDNEYTLRNIPIVITVKSDTFIVVRYTDEDGKPQDLNFVTIESDINELVAAEKDRRAKAYEQLCVFGPDFVSSNYGQLSLKNDGTFTWNNNRMLVPAVISSDARGGGTVGIKYILDKSLAVSFDGVLSFHFEGMDTEVNFLYKMESGGLRMEDATGAVIEGTIVTGRGMSPLVLFFTKGN